jgi:hypothetical protein
VTREHVLIWKRNIPMSLVVVGRVLRCEAGYLLAVSSMINHPHLFLNTLLLWQHCYVFYVHHTTTSLAGKQTVLRYLLWFSERRCSHDQYASSPRPCLFFTL